MTCFNALLPRLIIDFPKVSMSKLRISIICIFATWSLGAAGQQPPQPEDDGSLVLLHHLQQQEAGHEAGWAKGIIDNSKICIFWYRFQIYPDFHMVAGGRATSLLICRCLLWRTKVGNIFALQCCAFNSIENDALNPIFVDPRRIVDCFSHKSDITVNI